VTRNAVIDGSSDAPTAIAMLTISAAHQDLD
jgi:hypothetical protein